MRYKISVFVGRITMDHFLENFRKSGFVNNGITPWRDDCIKISPNVAYVFAHNFGETGNP